MIQKQKTRFYFFEQLASKRRLTFDLFLRAIGFIYFCAFSSLISQMLGLFGKDGILPISEYLRAVQAADVQLPYLGFPTIFWLSSSDPTLSAVVIAGTIISLCLICGRLPVICTTILYVLYLSITTVGQDFLSYQWDMLLLQGGFLAIIVSLLKASPGSRWLWILTTFFIFWLDFRLMFSSGMCKIFSLDPTWSGLTALTYHFSTQPLPTPLAILPNAMPMALSKVVCWLTLFVEIIVPFFIFAPRLFRLWACALLMGLQIIIELTGNYCFFNLLTITLLIPLLDDTLLRRLYKLLPPCPPLLQRQTKRPILRGAKRLVCYFSRSPKDNPQQQAKAASTGVKVNCLVAAFCLLLVAFNCLFDLSAKFLYGREFLPLLTLRALSRRYGIDNNYGLFAVMTLARPEIMIEGSNDGENYLPYDFKYKINNQNQAPSIVAPHQPRLDWQMWFEGLNATGGEPYDPAHGLNKSYTEWFIRFLIKLSAGDKAVLNLLAKNPFPNHPPKYLRARVFNYTLVSPIELMQTGKWWRSEEVGTYFDSKDLRR